MVAILENGRHFEILRGTRYFLNKAPREILVQLLVLLSQFERLFQLSAPLVSKQTELPSWSTDMMYVKRAWRQKLTYVEYFVRGLEAYNLL